MPRALNTVLQAVIISSTSLSSTPEVAFVFATTPKVMTSGEHAPRRRPWAERVGDLGVYEPLEAGFTETGVFAWVRGFLT